MGDMADYYNEYQADSMEEMLDYETGRYSENEAIERGILDEDGSMPNIDPIWGVHDAESLKHELDKCELELRRANVPKPKKKYFWLSSNGALFDPVKMSTQHLKNAIRQAERMRVNHPVVSQMREILKGRSDG